MLIEGALSNGGAPTRFTKRLPPKEATLRQKRSSPKRSTRRSIAIHQKPSSLPEALRKALHGYSPKAPDPSPEALHKTFYGYSPKAPVPSPEALHKALHETKKPFFSFRGKLDPTFLSKLAKSGGLGNHQKALFRTDSLIVTNNSRFVTFLETLMRVFAKRIPRFSHF